MKSRAMLFIIIRSNKKLRSPSIITRINLQRKLFPMI